MPRQEFPENELPKHTSALRTQQLNNDDAHSAGHYLGFYDDDLGGAKAADSIAYGARGEIRVGEQPVSEYSEHPSLQKLWDTAERLLALVYIVSPDTDGKQQVYTPVRLDSGTKPSLLSQIGISFEKKGDDRLTRWLNKLRPANRSSEIVVGLSPDGKSKQIDVSIEKNSKNPQTNFWEKLRISLIPATQEILVTQYEQEIGRGPYGEGVKTRSLRWGELENVQLLLDHQVETFEEQADEKLDEYRSVEGVPYSHVSREYLESDLALERQLPYKQAVYEAKLALAYFFCNNPETDGVGSLDVSIRHAKGPQIENGTALSELNTASYLHELTGQATDLQVIVSSEKHESDLDSNRHIIWKIPQLNDLVIDINIGSDEITISEQGEDSRKVKRLELPVIMQLMNASWQSFCEAWVQAHAEGVLRDEKKYQAVVSAILTDEKRRKNIRLEPITLLTAARIRRDEQLEAWDNRLAARKYTAEHMSDRPAAHDLWEKAREDHRIHTSLIKADYQKTKDKLKQDVEEQRVKHKRAYSAALQELHEADE